MKIIFSKRCFDYEFPGHPESCQRLKSIYNLLKDKELEFIEPELAKEEDILRIHSSDLVERVKKGEFLDPDTPNSNKDV